MTTKRYNNPYGVQPERENVAGFRNYPYGIAAMRDPINQMSQQIEYMEKMIRSLENHVQILEKKLITSTSI